MRLIKKALAVVGTTALAVVIVLLGFMVLGPRFGWETHAVLSGSMEPTLSVGGMIVTRPERIENIAVGDVITFKSGQQTITHRVARIIEQAGSRWFETKGDANNAPDANLVTSNTGQMRKVVFYVPYVGFLASSVRSKLGFLTIAGVPALILVVMLLRDLWDGIAAVRAKGRQAAINPERPRAGAER